MVKRLDSFLSFLAHIWKYNNYQSMQAVQDTLREDKVRQEMTEAIRGREGLCNYCLVCMFSIGDRGRREGV